MALSFSDSLKKQAQSAQTTTASTPKVASLSPLSLDESNAATASITSIEDEGNWIESAKYLKYHDYSDDNLSIVDDEKNVVVNEKQINLTQESNSQYIPFQMNRYYDGFDLMSVNLLIYFVNKENKAEYANPINVKYNNTKIRFGWIVDKFATAIAGNLTFEIHAIGVNSKGDEYIWKTKPNSSLNVLKSLAGDGFIEPDITWITTFMTQVTDQVALAQLAAQQAYGYVDEVSEYAQIAQDAATNAANVVDTAKDELTTTVADAVNTKVSESLSSYYNREEVDALIESIDISDQLTDVVIRLEDQIDATNTRIDNIDGLAAFNVEYDGTTMTFYNGESVIKKIKINSDPSAEWVTAYDSKMDSKISTATAAVQQNLDDYVSKTDTDLQSIHNAIDGLPETLASDYYTKSVTDELLFHKADSSKVASLEQTFSSVESTANTNKTNITSLGTKVSGLETELNSIDKSPRLTYEATYDEENLYTLWEIENEGQGDAEVRSPKGQFKIVGGSGGGSSSVLKIEYITKTPMTITINDSALIKYNFSGTDSSGDAVQDGNASWKINGSVAASEIISAGENEFDVTKYLSLGSNKVVLSITDDAGSLVTKTWNIQKIDVRLESTFNDTLTYPIGTVSFDYTPYGAIEKTVHFILDGEELESVNTSVSGIPQAYILPEQSHGSHLVETYITATVNNNEIETNHIVKDVIWYDPSSTIPVIGCVQQNFTTRQYDTTNIVYTVYDPTTETPEVTLAIDGKTVSTLKLDASTQTWQFKTADVGDHVLTITCGETVKTLKATVTKLDINVEPVTAGLAFDFNPVGRNNNDANRLWTDENNTSISMSVSDNFDWINGGYQIDANGDQYFCIKAGNTATINYKLFEDDAKKNGKEFKLIFKTENVANPDATFLKCLDNTTDTNHIGIQMDAHEARIYAMSEHLPLPYAEDEIIEFEFNISKNTEVPSMVMGYEDGVSTRPLVYEDSHSFTQTNPQIITLGSPDCDLHIYRFKVYNTSLTDRGILNNFIADARNAEEMIDRYDRNQIYDENGQLNPDVLAKKCPWLRVIKIECPRFTQDKDDKVAGCKIQYIYTEGDPILDNWVCIDGVISGQGTSSNNYGPAGRNLDLILKTYKDYGNNPVITLGDGKTIVKKISLTRNSVDVNYLNVKVNIASSENANNALLQKRYNTYNPYKRPFIREDESEIPKIKDTMEFFNTVIFIKEGIVRDDGSIDISNNVEFADNEYHFYAIGNVGDSKKTDNSRLTDQDDKYECVLEVMDNTLPLSTMPTGKVDEKGNPVYPIPESEWTIGNTVYDALMAEQFDELKAVDKENGKADTYGWRYIYEDGSDEENAEVREFVQNKWREFYKFVVTSSNEDFKAHLGDYVVLDSVLYFYLFTLRYTMTDNHAKNSFWHYGKSNDKDESGNNIRKWSLDFFYDADTALGIDNYGRMSYRYGYEEIDFVDGTNDWVWNAPQHVFFLRIRELFDAELCALYTKLESQGCWSATSLINQFNEWQMQFPEELWRLDIVRKYIRTFTSSFINGEARPEFLKERANGRKKTQRSQFEKNQEKYMASKFGGTVASADDIILRCSVPNTELAVQPNFDMHLTPFSHIYLNVKYNTSPPIKIRAVPNQEYTIEYDSDLADIIEIYSASCLTDIGDLSACYLTNGDFANASKIRELTLGNSTEGYNNTNVMTLGLGSNTLLNKLDIQNMSGLTHALNLSALKNLRELYAHGSNIGGVTFANGGLIEIAELPAINSMTMRNLLYLTDLDIVSFDKLTTLTIENCNSVDVVSILNKASNVNRVRITGVDWTIEDNSLLERIYNMTGIDAGGYNTTRAVLSGQVHVPVMREKLLADYNAAWPDLIITYNTLVQQFSATFYNEDGSILDVQYVDKGTAPVDPIYRSENPIPIPTKESTVSTDFTFAKWDSEFIPAFENLTFTATYSESLRQYTIRYLSMGQVLQENVDDYGANVPYIKELPVYVAEESAYKYYLFSHWDKSGLITGDKDVNAVYDSFEYYAGCFEGKDISTMRPVEIYAMCKLGLEETYVDSKDSITMSFGNDYKYNDVESHEIISEKTIFNGTNYIDSGVKLIDKDQDFVVAIDYKMDSTTAFGGVLAQCFQSNGSNGFKLWNNNGVKVSWGTTISNNLGTLNNREMLVLRHRKGEQGLYVYFSDMENTDMYYTTLSKTKDTIGDTTLVFGCQKADDGRYENFGVGTIYWAKVWMMDLGDSACRELAQWTHEKLKLEMAGFRNYYLSDNSNKRSSMTFVASHLLDRGRVYDSDSTNEGGWALSTLNAYMNDRMYKSIAPEWRQLIKQVKVPSSIGNKSTELSYSDCYLTVPAVYSLDPNHNSDPYVFEGNRFPFITTQDTRIRSYDGGDDAAYWTRSPNVTHTTYICTINELGAVYKFVYPYETRGVLVELSI